jgi:hypothetical protein
MYWGPVGGAVGGIIGGALDSFFGGGGHSAPPPPEGVVHFSWDAQGQIQHSVDFNQSGGGDAANTVASSVQTLLQSMVQAINAQNPDTADDVALNPYLIPRIGFSGSSAWMEVTNADGTTVREGINAQTIAQRLAIVLHDNGGLAPAWQVQTVQAHAQGLQEQGATQEQIQRELSAGIGGQATAGNEAYALQGNATESADFKSQSFGALVVHINADPQVQGHADKLQMTLVNVLRDADSDGYLEATQSVAAFDAQGHAQGVLMLDMNGNELIETRDVLNQGRQAANESNIWIAA